MVDTLGNGDGPWYPVDLPSDGTILLDYMRGGYNANPVAYGNGIYLTLATNNFSQPARTIVSTSPDGVAWNISLSDTQIFDGASSNRVQWSGVAFGAGIFVITYSKGTGGIGIVTTTDGTSLTYQRGLMLPNNSSVIFVNGYFFILSYGGLSDKLIYSQDGLNWSTAILPYAITQFAIIYAFGEWVMVDHIVNHDRIFVSADIVTWSTRKTGVFYYGNGNMVFGNDLIVLGDFGNYVIYSADGRNWFRCPTYDPDLGTILYGNKTFLATRRYFGPLLRAICP